MLRVLLQADGSQWSIVAQQVQHVPGCLPWMLVGRPPLHCSHNVSILTCVCTMRPRFLFICRVQYISTAEEQVVACAPVTQRARVRSPVGTGFLGEVFFGVFFSPVRQISGNFRHPKVPDYQLAVVFIVPYSPCWDDWVCAWCVLSLTFVLSRRWPRHWADYSSREALHVLVWPKKYVCDP